MIAREMAFSFMVMTLEVVQPFLHEWRARQAKAPGRHRVRVGKSVPRRTTVP
jgi:hypothetical protein